MRIGSRQGTSFSRSLFGQYLVGNGSQPSAEQKRLLKQVSAEQGSIQDLRGQLLQAANKLKKFADLGGFQGGGSGTGSSLISDQVVQNGGGNGQPAPAGPVPLTVRIGDSNKPKKFGREVFSSLHDGFASGDEKILDNKTLEGNIEFSIGDGQNQTNVSVHVDGDTTAQSFVDQFNSKAGSQARASLINVGSEGSPLYKIQVETSPVTQPPAEEGAPSTTTYQHSVILGNGPGPGAGPGSAEAAQIAQDLKSFVKSYNTLVDITNHGNDSNGSLTGTTIDEQLLQSFSGIFENAVSDDGSVRFDSFLRESSGGKLQFDTDRFISSFVENPDAVTSVLHDVAIGVNGSRGVARQFAGYGAGFDQAIQQSEVRALQSTLSDLEDSSQGQLTQAESDSTRLTSATTRLSSGTDFLKSLS